MMIIRFDEQLSIGSGRCMMIIRSDEQLSIGSGRCIMIIRFDEQRSIGSRSLQLSDEPGDWVRAARV